jgi:hypothetical protein
MQLPTSDDDLRLTFYIKDPASQGGDDCETFYRTNRRSWMLQAPQATSTALAQFVSLAPGEVGSEMSDGTMDAFVVKYVKECYGVDLSTTARTTEPGRTGSPQAGAT